MDKEIIFIENLKCGGCANSITSSLLKMDHVSDVVIDLESCKVEVKHDGEVLRTSIISNLGKLGYPEAGTGNTMQKVKSYISCAAGRLNS